VIRPLEGPVVLDAEGLARAVKKDPYISGVISLAGHSSVAVVTSAATIVEVSNAKPNLAALNWTVSRLKVEPVTKQLAVSAAGLLAQAGLSGHRHALDAMVCATALALSGRPTIYTSDPDDIERLVAGKADVIPLR